MKSTLSYEISNGARSGLLYGRKEAIRMLHFPRQKNLRSSHEPRSLALGRTQELPTTIGQIILILLVVWAPIVGAIIVALVRIATSIITSINHGL